MNLLKNKIMRISVIIIAIGVFISSCSIEKRQYMRGCHVQWNKTESNKQTKLSPNVEITEKVNQIDIEEDYNTVAILENPQENSSEKIYILPKQSKKTIINTDNECDEIILKDGQIIKGKIQEIGVDEIKYKKCENLDGPVIVIKKSTVFMIKYLNGTTDVINSINESKKNSDKKFDPFSLVSFVSAILALVGGTIVALASEAILLGIGLGLVLALLAVIFGIISLRKIKKNKEVLKGKEFAVMGIIIGGLALLIMGFLTLYFFVG